MTVRSVGAAIDEGDPAEPECPQTGRGVDIAKTTQMTLLGHPRRLFGGLPSPVSQLRNRWDAAGETGIKRIVTRPYPCDDIEHNQCQRAEQQHCARSRMAGDQDW